MGAKCWITEVEPVIMYTFKQALVLHWHDLNHFSMKYLVMDLWDGFTSLVLTVEVEYAYIQQIE